MLYDCGMDKTHPNSPFAECCEEAGDLCDECFNKDDCCLYDEWRKENETEDWANEKLIYLAENFEKKDMDKIIEFLEEIL